MFHRSPSRSLRWEISLALALKVVLLTALWFAVFRHPPDAPKAQVADLFAPARPAPTLYQEHSRHVR